MLSCKEVARILSSDEELTFMVKSELKIHLLMCKHCSNYNKQMKHLVGGMKRLFSKRTDVDEGKIHELEKEIIEKYSKSS